MNKQEAINIINWFLDWFNYHHFAVDAKLRNRIDDFINGG